MEELELLKRAARRVIWAWHSPHAGGHTMYASIAALAEALGEKINAGYGDPPPDSGSGA